MVRDRVERMQFRRAPLGAAAVWLGAGIVLAHWVWQPVGVILGAVGLLAGLAVVGLVWGPRVAWVPVAGVWIAVGMALRLWQPGPPGTAQLAGYADGLSRRVVGRVTRVQVLPARVQLDADTVPPWEAAEEAEPESERAISVDLALEQVEEVTPDVAQMVAVAGELRATVYGAAPELGCGDRVEATVRMRVPERFRDPGVWQYADYLAEQGVAARTSLAGGRLRRLGAGPATWHCRVLAARGWAVARLAGFVGSRANRRMPRLARLDGADAGMLDAMLFGDRAGLSRGMRLGFERTGSFHLFVVSGLHVTLLAGGVFWGLRRLLRAPPWGATLGTIAVAMGYAVLTGFGQPVQRALAMSSIFLLARLFWRRSNGVNALGLAALVMMVWSPGCLFEASFQMTVLAIVAIAGMAVPLGEWTVAGSARAAKDIFGAGVRGGLTPRRAQLRVMLQLWGDSFEGVFGRWSRRIPAQVVRGVLLGLELALVGLVAELVMVLPMALYFHRAAVFALPANMVVIPVLAVLAPAAVATFAAAVVSPWMALLPGAVTALLLHGVTGAIGRLSGLAVADVRVPGPVWWVGVTGLMAWAACCWAVRRGRWGAWTAAAVLPMVGAMVLWSEPVRWTPDRLEMTAIDVGQGDSLLLVGPEGAAMLVDAGGPVGQHGVAEVTSSYDVGEEVVSPYLWSRRMRRLDVVVLTHAHSDHMGGMAAVLRNFQPRELWVGVDPDSAGYRALLAEAASLGIQVRHLRAGDALEWGGTAVIVLAPAAEYGNPGAPKNDDSLVLRMEFGRGSVLLEGDAERASERTMLAAGRVSPVTVLKVGHHGSYTSTSAEFLAAASPRDAVISVGRENSFGHPRGEVIGRIAGSGARLYRTDTFGLTTFLIERNGAVEEVLGVR